MMRLLFTIAFTCLLQLAFTQVHYTLAYTDSMAARVTVVIQPQQPVAGNTNFIMPRSIPGNYSISLYDSFIENLYAITVQGKKIALVKNAMNAPRWNAADNNQPIASIEYEVNLDRMERSMAPADVAVIRPGFMGILNYAVFGWIEGLEKQPAHCVVNTFANWPIFCTHAPSANLQKGKLSFTASNYYTLADGQIFAGPTFQLKTFAGAVPLYIVSYSQTRAELLDDYGKQGMLCMAILKDYFGELPFTHYSILLRKCTPLLPGSYPSFGMEHLQSSTFFGDSSEVRTATMSQDMLIKTLPTYLHHMGHSLIPLNCYGDNYRPYALEIAPIINNIWFNEGFMWFMPYDTLHLEKMKTRFYKNVYQTDAAIKQLSLQQLSQTASTQYALDFRLGQAIYSRGAMMAIEMNEYLQKQSGGKKSMRDVLRYLYQWAKTNQRPFTMDEFPVLINQACGISLTAIYQKWQLPIN